MEDQKKRPCGEQPQGLGSGITPTPVNVGHDVGDLRGDGNSYAQDVLVLKEKAAALAAMIARHRAEIEASNRRLAIWDAILDSDFSADEKLAFLKEAGK